jgi:hypothetical protein
VFTGTTGRAAHWDFMTLRRHLFALLVASSLSIGVAHAQTAEPASGSLVRLTPEQVEAAKEAAAERNMKTAEAGFDTSIMPDRGPHGEVGIAVGTGGYRSIYGSTVMPLGKDGVLAFSFENTQNDPYRYGYGYGRTVGPGYRR